MISEQDNTPEEVKGRVTQMTKAIRYKARKEGGNLFKAFNDYMGSQSGISSTERQLVKQKLGLTERYSSWRDELELREVVDVPSSEPKTDKEMEKTVKEKKVKNKIVINPSMQEAIEEIGGTILEVVEIDEQDQELTPDQKKQLQIKSQMMKKQQMLDRQRLQAQRSGKLPMGRAHEGYAPGDVDQKVGAVTAIPKDEQDAAKARLLAKTKAKREMRKEGVGQVGEGVLDDALKTDKKMGELHKKVDNDVKRMKAGKKFKEEVEQVDERVLDRAEKGEKERIVKGMKKKFSSFKDRYGKDAKSVMYATATKMAKDNMDTSKSDRRYGVE
jgi:hypothetical protein